MHTDILRLGDVGFLGYFVVELLVSDWGKHLLHLTSKLLLLLKFLLDPLLLVIGFILLESLKDFLLTSLWCFLDKSFVQIVLNLFNFTFHLLLFEFGNLLLRLHLLGNQLIVKLRLRAVILPRGQLFCQCLKDCAVHTDNCEV